MAAKEKSQSEKFIEKAKELGADESGEAFTRAFKRVLAPKEQLQPPVQRQAAKARRKRP